MADLERLESGSLKGLLEALLLVSDDSVSAVDLAKTCGVAPGDVAEALAQLSVEYREANRGFQLREVAGGWRLFTHPAFHDQVADYVVSWDTRRLSQAALETLAVIAYHQPVTREGVRAIRGVNSDGVIASLREKNLVRELGRDADHGQAQLWGTTRQFLERFGLKSLRELPPLEDFAPDEESKQFIRERLSGRTFSSTLEDAVADMEDERELLGDEGEEAHEDPATDETGDDASDAEADAAMSFRAKRGISGLNSNDSFAGDQQPAKPEISRSLTLPRNDAGAADADIVTDVSTPTTSEAADE